MDEEQTSKKISIDSFFNRVDEVDKVAKSALKKSTNNLSSINASKLLVDSISVSIDAMKTEIRDIANYIVIENKLEKDAAEDRRLEEQDLKQKQAMTDRALAMGERGPKGDPGTPAEEQKGGGGSFLGGLIKTLFAGGGLLLAAKTLFPALLPFLGKALIPKIALGLKGIFVGSFKGLAGLLTKGVTATLGKVPLLGKAAIGFSKALGTGILKAGKIAAGIIASAFTFNGLMGGGAKAGENNMSFSSDVGGSGIADQLNEDGKVTKEELKNKNEKPVEVGGFEPEEKKPEGIMRGLAGVGDFLTGGVFDLDKRGESVTDKITPSGMLFRAADIAPPPQTDSSSIAPANTPNTSEVIIRPTTPTVPYVRAIKNQYLSINPNRNKLPAEIARMIQ